MYLAADTHNTGNDAGDIESGNGDASSPEHHYKTSMLEAKYQLSKALPMVVAGVFRSWISILEVQALGHLGKKELAGRSIALLVVNLTGYLTMYAFGGALESLCSQAYTAARGQKKIGVYIQHSLVLFLVANIPIMALWLNPDMVFRLLSKTDPDVLRFARIYLQYECLYFPCIVIQSCLKRFLLAQGLMRPTILFEFAGLLTMYMALQVLVWTPQTSLGFAGVPLAATISYLAVLGTNVLYIILSPCRSEWGPLFTTADFYRNSRLIITLGIPCAISGIASYGFADLATVAVTTLGTESLAVQAVLNSTKSALTRTGAYLGMVISNRVGNLLGAQMADNAFLSAKVSTLMTLAFTSVIAFGILAFQDKVAAFITNDETVIAGLLPVIPLLVVVMIFDMLSNVLTGVLRGQGRQGIAATIRVVSLYGIAVPLAYFLCFPLRLGLYGLWMGLCAGFIAISAAEGWLVLSSDWQEETEQVTFAMQTFEQIHPLEFQRRFLSQETRHDGRAFLQFRPTHVVKGTISTAQGSATVRIGNTTVVCGIKAEVCEPDVKTPDEGYLVTNVELSPMCSAHFRPGAPSEEAQVASEHIHRLFARHVVDLNSLCIESGSAAWVLTADIICLKYDGNVLDAAIIALLAALEDLSLPAAELDSATGVVNADRSSAQKLRLSKRLFPATFSLVDDAYLVADATDAEEQMASASALVILDDKGSLANIWKRGAGAISRQTIEDCVERATTRKDSLVKLLG
ncbi:hypothetical protein GGI12_000473 [Dipsacomyces acuminosporus]|nr:hypothetical protein GGI12_000473 [Dipsacomyces acuminosporus]